MPTEMIIIGKELILGLTSVIANNTKVKNTKTMFEILGELFLVMVVIVFTNIDNKNSINNLDLEILLFMIFAKIKILEKIIDRYTNEYSMYCK
ncbi:hypothetical protein ACTQ2N_07930 [Ruminococcus sp. LCP21S3_E8]